MSDSQFSTLSSNSSTGLQVRTLFQEEINFCDQDTVSITTDKTIANLEDFDNDFDFYKFKVDPFLSDFMKEDTEEYGRQSSFEPYTDSYDINGFISSDHNLDYISVTTDNLETVSPELLDWDTLSSQKTSSNKCISSTIDQGDVLHLSLPKKLRRVQVSYHEICDEWINKYHELPNKFSLRASGATNRRKTKHDKVLTDCDMDSFLDNNDVQRNKISIYLSQKSSLFQNTICNFSSPNNIAPISISSFSHKFHTIRSINRNTILKPFNSKNICEVQKTSNIRENNDVIISSTYIQTKVSSSNMSKDFSEIVEMAKMPGPLKMGKRVCRRGHRLSLWQFLLCLLDSYKYKEHSTGIKWINRNNGIFHIIDSKQVATLWGVYKERRAKMTYDSLARSLRHYYKKNLMAKINNRRLVYQIAQECIQWSSETFLKRIRE